MEKFDLTNLNNLIRETGKIIDNDPLAVAAGEIEIIKRNFDAIQDAIQEGKDGNNEKSKSLLGTIFSSWAKRDEGFQFKSFEHKITSIFSQFDLVHDSVLNSIEMYEGFSKGLNSELDKLKDFLSKYPVEELTKEDIMEYKNYNVMVDTLSLSLSRISVSLQSATDLNNTMEITRPIFQAVLSSCLIEVAGQRSLDSSIQMMGVLNGTIEAISTKLTTSTIQTSQMALDIGTKPLLSSGKLQENMLLLGNALEEINSKKTLLLSK